MVKVTSRLVGGVEPDTAFLGSVGILEVLMIAFTPRALVLTSMGAYL